MKKLRVFDDLAELSHFAAKQFVAIGKRAVKSKGKFTVALSGGTTPQVFYELLASDEFRKELDWETVFFFFGDERDVSPMSERSNFRIANEYLLKNLSIPPSNILRWRTEIIEATGVAAAYEKAITRFFELSSGEFPKLDLVMLGLGTDGHTASLFPQSDALSEKKRIAISTYVEKLDSNRLTLTIPTFNKAVNVLFLVSGKEKALALKEVLEGKETGEKFPAKLIIPASGRLTWLADSAAAELLKKKK